MTRLVSLISALAFTSALAYPAAEDRRARVLNDRAEVESAGDWIYNDLPQGIEKAAQSGKPLLVVFRCLP